MKTVLVAAVMFMILVSGVSLSESKEKKKKVTTAPSSAPSPTVDAKPAPASPPVSVPATPPGWTNVKVDAQNLAKVIYKIEGREIIVRFYNISAKSPVRFKYTVKWKRNRNGAWVDDSTMEGISFRLKPLEQLERDIRTGAPEIKDVVVDIEASETS